MRSTQSRSQLSWHPPKFPPPPPPPPRPCPPAKGGWRLLGAGALPPEEAPRDRAARRPGTRILELDPTKREARPKQGRAPQTCSDSEHHETNVPGEPLEQSKNIGDGVFWLGPSLIPGAPASPKPRLERRQRKGRGERLHRADSCLAHRNRAVGRTRQDILSKNLLFCLRNASRVGLGLCHNHLCSQHKANGRLFVPFVLTDPSSRPTALRPSLPD